MKNKDLRKEQSNEDQMKGYDPTDRNFDHTEVAGDPHVDDPRDQPTSDNDENPRKDKQDKANEED